MTNNTPSPSLNSGWKRVKTGLLWMSLTILVSPVLAFIEAFFVISVSGIFTGELASTNGMVLPIVFLAGFLPFLVGIFQCFASPDALSRGFMAGCFLSLILGIASTIWFFQFPLRNSPLVNLGVGIFIILLFQASISFFLLFLLRLARCFAGRDLAVNCQCFFIVETLLTVLLVGGMVNHDLSQLSVVNWNLPDDGLYFGLWMFYIWFPALLIHAWITIDLTLAKASSNQP